jgi:LPXTG-motif cell wall-anchored protein
VRQRLGSTAVHRRRGTYGPLVAAALVLAATTLGAPAAGADAGWSRVPASGIGGGTVDVASSSSTLCQWIQPANAGDAVADPSAAPAAAAEGDVVYDGTEVRVRLSRDGVDVPIGQLTVMTGGAWSGTITLPASDTLLPGVYDMIAKCVVDRPELDGVRTYDFDPLEFIVTESPPPTTVEVPTELVPPITAVNPVQVEGVQLTRPTSTPATAATAAPTLPKTGDSTIGIALAGLGSLLVGGAALWWGARHARRHPSSDLVDGRRATG